MIEPLSVGLHAAKRGEVGMGKSVLVIGVGTIGFMTMLACRAMGASKIIVSDSLDNRLELAARFGADVTINITAEDAVERVMQETDGLGCDVVFEASGAPAALASTWKYVKNGGAIVNVGNAGGEVPYLFGELARKEADIRSVWRYRHTYPMAIEAVSRGLIPLRDLEPTVFPFEKAEEAFFYAIEQRSKVLKTMIRVSE